MSSRPLPSEPPTTAWPTPLGRASRLVGRDAERARLDRLLDEVAGGGESRLVQITGDPGIGKTCLLSELAARCAARGWVVLWGQAAEFERQVPFGAVVNALDDHLATIAAARLDSESRRLLAAILPSLAAPPDDAPDVPVLDVERYRLHRAMRRLLEALTGPGGVLLVFDDLHWADDGSFELLDHMVRHPPRGRLLVAVAYRPRQAPTLLHRALTHAVASGRGESVELGPLTADETARLLDRGVTPRRRQELYQASGGNPLYLQALARCDREPAPGLMGAQILVDVPATVRAALSAELAALTSPQSLVAQAAAVAGDRFDVELVAEIAQLAEKHVMTALDQLTRRDLIRPTDSGGAFAYRHPLLRAAAYHSAGAGWRIGAHGRAAAALRRRGAPPAIQAHHVERSARAGDLQAVEILTRAATAALNVAPASAAHWLGAALRIMPHEESLAASRVALAGMRGRALGAVGRLRESRDALREVMRLLPAEPVTPRAQVAGFCAMIERLLGNHAEARALLLRELAALPDKRSSASAILRLELASGGLLGGDFAGRAGWAHEALTIARDSCDPALLAAALGMCLLASCAAGTVGDQEFAWLTEAASVVDALPDTDLARHLQAAVWLGWSEMYLERLDDALRHLDRGLRLARATGQNHLVTYLLMGSATCHTLLGRLREAAAGIDDALEAARLTGSEELHTMALSHRCWIATWMGAVTEAHRLGAEAVTSAGTEDDWFSRVATAMLAQAHFYAHDPARCVELLLKAGGGPALTLLDPMSRPGWHQLLAAAYAALSRPREAATAADHAAAAADDLRLPRRVGFARLARADALLAVAPGEAWTAAHAAATSFLDVGDRVDAGRSYLVAALGSAATGRVDQARDEFALARELFRGCEAHLFVQRVTREERRMNARLPRRSRRADTSAGPSGGTLAERHGLTPREQELAELVARGLTNRRIAEQLHLSPKTVEAHLSRVFAKLGVTSRAAVAALIGASEL